MTTPKSTRPFIAAAPLAVAVACATPALVHFDGHPFQPLGPLERIGGGWVAIDSCAQGVHALVELEIDQDTPRDVRSLVQSFALALEPGITRRATHVEIMGPFCWSRPPDSIVTHRPAREDVSLRGHDPDSDCTTIYVVRAEFDLQHLPRDGQTLAVLHGNRRTAVTWTRR